MWHVLMMIGLGCDSELLRQWIPVVDVAPCSGSIMVFGVFMRDGNHSGGVGTPAVSKLTCWLHSVCEESDEISEAHSCDKRGNHGGDADGAPVC